MVYFDCSTCGVGLKKNQIEKHLLKCHSRGFCCIDCGQDFRGNDYVNHNKCISEAKKYEGKNYVEKASKGEQKQMVWFEKVLKSINDSNPNPKVKFLFEKLKNYPNIPRKKTKFINFVKNSLRSFNINDHIIHEIWNIIELTDKNDRNEENNSKKRSHEQGDECESNKKSKVNDPEDELSQNNIKNESNEVESDKFNWIDVVRALLMKNENNEISIEKLRKKIFKKYKAIKQCEQIDEEKLNKKLFKKLEKHSNVFEAYKNENQEIVKIKLICS